MVSAVRHDTTNTVDSTYLVRSLLHLPQPNSCLKHKIKEKRLWLSYTIGDIDNSSRYPLEGRQDNDI